MKERSISFTDDMVQAILDGWKGQTRRPLKQEAIEQIEWAIMPDGSLGGIGFSFDYCCPYGVPGDRLIVRRRGFPKITLEVTAVRVELLQDISRGDCMEEGCLFPNMAGGESPVKWFSDLWESIYGPGSWDENPWVWVIEFKRI